MTEADEELLLRRLDRERRARLEAEGIAERATAELYAAVLELERTNQTLDAANRSMSEFVAVASHDLRQPLNGILGLSYLLLSGWDSDPDERKLDYIATIERQGEHLNRIVQDLITVSKLDAGAMERHIEEVGVRRLLDEITTEFADAADISVACPSDLNVHTDPDHLRRVVVNYLTNALKYGEPPVDITVTLTDESVRLKVCDNGRGVPAEFIPRLFDRFARADETARSQEGTGLGLSIVRGLALANGGDAWYEPLTPQGSCFNLSLPRG
ncbi:MAG TPA: HAMP domain-containing sensor histidine kinase [Acidimicrobiales bacterium]|nr:HAMP domain-containing sensor histidine kinase [Acidimicrobiales bacterium]